MEQYPGDTPPHRNEGASHIERQSVLAGAGKPIRPCAERYWDDDGLLVEVVPAEVVQALKAAIDSPPPPDVRKAKRLAALLHRSRES